MNLSTEALYKRCAGCGARYRGAATLASYVSCWLDTYESKCAVYCRVDRDITPPQNRVFVLEDD
jgi:hypothetical protein